MLWTSFKHISLSSERNAFSNKAFNTTEINTEVKVLGLAKTLMVYENQSTLTEEDFDPIWRQ
jgi:electron transfer flavoprotein alpha subunit